VKFYEKYDQEKSSIMKTIIHSLVIVFCALVVQNSWAQGCNFREKITYPNGSVGCIKDLKLPPKDNKGFNLSQMLNAQVGFVAISNQLSCKALAYGGALMGATSNTNLIAEARSRTLKDCESLGCACTLLLDDGFVKLDGLEILKAQNNATSFLSTQVAIKPQTEQGKELVGQSTGAQLRASEENQLKEQQKLTLDAQQKEPGRLTQASKPKEQYLLIEQKEKDQRRIAEEIRIREQQRLFLEDSEIRKLRAEAEESRRKQAELEEQLRLFKQQSQVAALPVMTTMANRKALVIGNDTYKSVTKLLNAREDANAIASNLIAVGYKVTLLLDLNEKEMKAALRTFSSQVQGGDEVMFFFAGHGVQLGSTNYLLPIDIGSESEAQVKDEAIQLQRVLDDMTEKKAKFTLAMIDACRDNPFKSSGRNIGGRGLAPTTAATGQMVVFSAGTGQQALDRLGNNDKSKNGVFTRTFLKEMQKPGISIDRIVKNVRNEVAELAKTIGHEQVPAIYDQVLGDFYFMK
jgi:hypothetical protein